MKGFDLYQELIGKGFEKSNDEFNRECLAKHYEKEVEVCWYRGTWHSTFDIKAVFNPDHTVVKVFYYNQSKTPFKTKTHISSKKAYNAICQTLRNNGYEL